MRYRLTDPDERRAFELLGYEPYFTDEDIKRHHWTRLGDELYFYSTVAVEPMDEPKYFDAKKTTLGVKARLTEPCYSVAATTGGCAPEKEESGSQKD